VSADNLQSTYLRLRPDSSIEKLPADATFWPRLMSGQLGNFQHEYLVTSYNCNGDWASWEMHPNGDEIVCLLTGRVDFILESADGQHSTMELSQPGSFAFVPRGTWHTAKNAGNATLLFITAGEDTQHRPAEEQR
jgi:oxalate decarboxylase/phosphoglucose isomerase-like protein (cupin superfamily)